MVAFGGKFIDSIGRSAAAADVDPDVNFSGFAAVEIQHSDRRFVGENNVAVDYVALHEFVKRPQCFRYFDPTRTRGLAVELNPSGRPQLLGQSGIGQIQHVFGIDHPGVPALVEDAAGDREIRGRCAFHARQRIRRLGVFEIDKNLDEPVAGGLSRSTSFKMSSNTLWRSSVSMIFSDFCPNPAFCSSLMVRSCRAMISDCLAMRVFCSSMMDRKAVSSAST